VSSAAANILEPGEATLIGKEHPGPTERQNVAIVLKGYPRLSETFIAQEIRALEKAGLDLSLYSLRHPTDPTVHPIHREIEAAVTYLPEYLHNAPIRVLRGWWRARRLSGYGEAWHRFLRDLRRDFTVNRVRRFGQACVLAAELPARITWLYAHFLHTPASVARYAALMRNLPWSVSAHAKDIWTTPDWEKKEKLSESSWAVTCTAAGHQHLAALAPGRIVLVYHGLDFARFPAPSSKRPRRNGSNPADPVVLLSVGRAVEKKGYDDLLSALAALPGGLQWRLVHIGGGELIGRVQKQAEHLGLADRITWLGPQPQETVLSHYRSADLFVLASRVAESGDRDGLPNVLMEAQSQALPCIATNVSGIPELIHPDQTGLLVPPRDPVRLAEAIQSLVCNPERRFALGLAGQVRVREDFASDQGVQALLQKFGRNESASIKL